MIKKIVIVGGGTAGWLAANHLGKRFLGSETVVKLIESANIPTIGVGEGTVPMMRQTLEYFGIDEGEFIKECNVAFKQGISFENWMAPQAGKTHRYYHPFDFFSSELGLVTAWLNDNSGIHFADFVGFQSTLCDHNLAPKLITQPQFDGAASYAYHLDAGAFSELLKKNAINNLGVVHHYNELDEVALDNDGAISHLVTDAGVETADLYIDCTGFKSLLLGTAMKTPFVAKGDVLFADKALAVQVPYADNEQIPSYTRSTAQTAGWIWDIGLYSRKGIGHVYSSSHTTETQAYAELESYIGTNLDSLNVRNIDMKVGYRSKAWSKNCVALGLSQGFVEPLEATGLLVFDVTAKMLADTLPTSTLAFETVAKHFNNTVTNMWSKVIDFIKLHYCISDRCDSQFWLDNRSPESIPDSLREKLELWKYKVPTNYDFGGKFDVFDIDNYLYVLYGMSYPTCVYSNLISPAEIRRMSDVIGTIKYQQKQARELAIDNKSLLEKIHQFGLAKQ
ncbi:tryptophan halogenase family protein [Pseudoalteromonas sp. Of7M-16]|uniref:tryptophan halogenase family protein n=1 Tax=Pseudoalteromonas sp. Of7M-16 TaxID=2917756 RepID=UPI001EF481A6|nr:tryptophan halogenase family protein [Pseudoalteromonas sp. Of7M-16]MCG7547783.1 tryptophan 7-halogenase [Pseudoalteromonas sp. Of7M-16]